MPLNCQPTKVKYIANTNGKGIAKRPGCYDWIKMDTMQIQLPTSLRARTPAETLGLIETVANLQRIGVKEVATHTLDEIQSIPIYEAIRDPSHRSDYFCLGKGFDPEHSKVSCLMEATEMSLIEQRAISTDKTFSELDPSALIYRRTWPQPIQKSQCCEVSKDNFRVYASKDIRSGETIYLVEQDIFYFAGNPKSANGPTTNGLASGNTREEAIIHGVCELIERDAMHEWGRRQLLHKHQVVTSEYTGPKISAILQKSLDEIFAAGYHVYLTRLPSEHHCYVYEAGLIRCKDGLTAAVFSGWGAHPLESIAMNRSVEEAVQILAMHYALMNNAIPEARLPGTTTAHRRASRMLGNQKVFERTLDRSFQNMSTQLWQLWYGPSPNWHDVDPTKHYSELLKPVTKKGKHFCASLNLAPDDFPFFAQLTICSNLNTPPGL